MECLPFVSFLTFSRLCGESEKLWGVQESPLSISEIEKNISQLEKI